MGTKRKIMVIDDEQDLRENLEYQFQAKDYEVLTACDGADGLEKLKSESPDLIILDLNMPNMGGIEFYNKVCDEKGMPKYPILILTARANTEQMFKELNIDGFITKPFEIDNVIKEAETIIESKQRKDVSADQAELIESRGIFFVEGDTDEFQKIGLAFLGVGYKVNSATSGTRAIEKMMMDPPCLALINLGLQDIPGDLVIEKLLRMSKTADIKFILYAHRNGSHDPAVLENMGQKSGVLGCMEYSDPDELLKAVDKAFQKGKLSETDE